MNSMPNYIEIVGGPYDGERHPLSEGERPRSILSIPRMRKGRPTAAAFMDPVDYLPEPNYDIHHYTVYYKKGHYYAEPMP